MAGSGQGAWAVDHYVLYPYPTSRGGGSWLWALCALPCTRRGRDGMGWDGMR